MYKKTDLPINDALEGSRCVKRLSESDQESGSIIERCSELYEDVCDREHDASIPETKIKIQHAPSTTTTDKFDLP